MEMMNELDQGIDYFEIENSISSGFAQSFQSLNEGLISRTKVDELFHENRDVYRLRKRVARTRLP